MRNNMNIQENIKRILREETNIKPALHNLLNMWFDGFDDMYYDWAEYNCGMGVCCDPYAIGFVLPGSEYDDYLFEFVDGNNYDVLGEYPKEITDELPEVCYESPDIKDPRFDTIVFYEVFAEDIENYFGDEDNWSFDLMDIINKKFGCDAKRIIFI
jgi:hypothetical protein